MSNRRIWWVEVAQLDQPGTLYAGNLTKQEAMTTAEGLIAEKWPRILIGQTSTRYPRGAYMGGIHCGHKHGTIWNTQKGGCGIAENLV